MPARNLVWVLIVATIALLLWNGPDVIARRETVYELFSPLVDVRAEIHKRYVEEVDDKSLMRGAVEGMLHSLDPFSSYLSPDDYPRFKQHTAGRFGGIGIEVGLKNGVLMVISPLENTPAFKAGILADDRILEIDGESTEHMTMADAVQKLMGAPGSQVTLKVRHTQTDQAETVAITRAEIEVASVWGWQRDGDNQWSYWLDPERKIAYVRISGFLDNTPPSFNAVIQRLVEADMRALVLDVRFNPGGSLPAAVAVAERFLDGGTIVSVRGRWRAEEVYKANQENTLPDFPVVVLVNDQTASGAEILAGSLRDHERAVVVGRRTYGKGSVQEVIELGSGNSAIKLTTAYYYLPDGELIHRTPAARQTGKWGVEPNVVVELSNEETQQIIESRMAADRVNGPSTRPGATAAKPVLDRQIVKALEVLREKMDKPEAVQKVAASQPGAAKAKTTGQRQD
jgi:carboxyl-terminal processing protease